MRYEDVVLADGPTGYWPLNELTGTVAANLGSAGANGTYTSSPITGSVAFPAGGRAAFMTGVPSYVQIPDNAAWSSGAGASGLLSVELWCYVAGVGASYASLVAKAGSGQYEWTMAHYASSLGLFTWQLNNLAASTSSVLDGTGKFAVGRWHHLVGTLDMAGAVQALYVNGRLDGTRAPGATMADGTGVIDIGYRGDVSGAYFGAVAHVAVYNRVLPHERIAAHYRTGLARPRRLANWKTRVYR